MKKLSQKNLTAESRVRLAINQAMEIYMNQLNTGLISIGLENAFQMHLASIIGDLLNINTYYPEEKFVIHFEKNMPINSNNDYVDIVINYHNKNSIEQYLMELKFKKISDSAPDLGNIESYIDIYNLDTHKKKTTNVKNCYFIFLTDLKTYTRKARSGTRTEIPMEDGYVIQKGKQYTVTGMAAKKNTIKYPNGFMFNSDYKIEYTQFNVSNKPYWYFILEL